VRGRRTRFSFHDVLVAIELQLNLICMKCDKLSFLN